LLSHFLTLFQSSGRPKIRLETGLPADKLFLV
jgi:hypothetical protein